MQNFFQPANIVTVPAPAAVTSGQGVTVGKIFGIAATNAASGQPVPLVIAGGVTLKKGAVNPAYGDAANFDTVGQTLVATGGKLIGYVINPSSPDDATQAVVKLIPTPV